MKCDRCEGKGTTFPITKLIGKINCTKCEGTGNVDWVENVVGRRKKRNRKVRTYPANIISKLND